MYKIAVTFKHAPEFVILESVYSHAITDEMLVYTSKNRYETQTGYIPIDNLATWSIIKTTEDTK